MGFMHMGATIAASAVGGIVGFEWDDSAPYSNIRIDDGGNGFWAESVLSIGGEGQASPFPTLGSYAGGYTSWEHGFLQDTAAWINPTFVANVDQYFFRSVDISVQSDGNVPGSRFTIAGYTGTRTDWRSFASISPHTNMTSDVLAQWACEAEGAYGSSYFEERLDLTIEIGKATGLVETFDFGDVSTGNDDITISSHGLLLGDQVIYTVGSGAPPSPLVDQGMYSVWKVDANRISLGNSLADIDASTNFINLTTQGSGTGHSLRRIDSEASVILDMDTSL